SSRRRLRSVSRSPRCSQDSSPGTDRVWGRSPRGESPHVRSGQERSRAGRGVRLSESFGVPMWLINEYSGQHGRRIGTADSLAATGDTPGVCTVLVVSVILVIKRAGSPC